MNEDIQNTSSNGGNEKQTRTTLKNINFVLLWMLHSLNTVHVSYIVPSTEPRFFLG